MSSRITLLIYLFIFKKTFILFYILQLFVFYFRVQTSFYSGKKLNYLQEQIKVNLTELNNIYITLKIRKLRYQKIYNRLLERNNIYKLIKKCVVVIFTVFLIYYTYITTVKKNNSIN